MEIRTWDLEWLQRFLVLFWDWWHCWKAHEHECSECSLHHRRYSILFFVRKYSTGVGFKPCKRSTSVEQASVAIAPSEWTKETAGNTIWSYDALLFQAMHVFPTIIHSLLSFIVSRATCLQHSPNNEGNDVFGELPFVKLNAMLDLLIQKLWHRINRFWQVACRHTKDIDYIRQSLRKR